MSPFVLFMNALAILMLGALGWFILWLYKSFGTKALFAGIVVIVLHQVWHRLRYGNWYGDDAFTIKDERVSGPPAASSSTDSRSKTHQTSERR